MQEKLTEAMRLLEQANALMNDAGIVCWDETLTAMLNDLDAAVTGAEM